MQHATAPGRRFTGPQLAVIIVVVGLVLTFAVMLQMRLGSGGAADAGQDVADGTGGRSELAGPAPSAEEPAAEPSEMPEREPEPEHLAAPSGNIVCSITADNADCVIRSFDYEPSDAADCPDGAGGHLRVEPAGATMPCEPLAVEGSVPELGYGEEITAHDYTCSSERSGVTCRHEGTGYGFTVARAGYELF